MKETVRFLCGLLLPTCFALSVVAQDFTPTPPPLPTDPAQLFADGIEVISSEVVPYRTPTAYPTYAPEPNLCPQQQAFDYGIWQPVLNTATGLFMLCNKQTGDYLPTTLPPRDYNGDLTPSVSTSPNGAWILVSQPECPCGQMNYQDAYYSYEIATDRWHDLGKISTLNSSMDTFLGGGWISDSMFFTNYGDTTESSPDFYYALDLAQDDSLTEIGSGWATGTWLYPDPYSRLEFLYTVAFVRAKTGAANWIPEPGCRFTVFDDDGLARFELGYDCGGHNPLRLGNQYYYIRFDSNPTQTSTLVRFDRLTDARRELFTGEIESLITLSPDGRYALLLMDRSGQIDLVDGDDQFTCSYLENTSPYIVLVDLQTSETLYTAEGCFEPFSWYRSSDYWIDDHLLHFSFYDWQSQNTESHLISVDRDASEPVHGVRFEAPITVSQTTAPDNPDVRIIQIGNSPAVVNTHTWALTSLLRIPVPYGYSIEAQWKTEDTLTVTFTPSYTQEEVAYTVRVRVPN